MGLHLCYELSLPADTPASEVVETLTRLHARAGQLPFERVSEVRQLRGPECELGTPTEFLGDAWWLFRFSAQGRAIRSPDPNLDVSFRPEFAAGFVVFPGKRCEIATFGVSLRPEFIEHGGAQLAVREPGWRWHWCCKTQYASILSDEHFLCCHLNLIALVEYAAGLGMGTVVRDETGYYEHRDQAQLLDTVHEWNRIIARFAGKLGDAIGQSGARAVAPIFDHPEFERLEMEE